jgi:hypothetical protein
MGSLAIAELPVKVKTEQHCRTGGLVREFETFADYTDPASLPSNGGDPMPSKLHLAASTLFFIIIASCCLDANSQTDDRGPYVFLPNQEVRVVALPSTVAVSRSEADILTASVATAMLEGDVCCSRNSALEDRISSATGLSLRELGGKLRGRAYLDDGSPILVADQYWSGASIRADDIISSLMAQHPLLMDWSGHLYVLYGAVFDEYRYYESGTRVHVIRALSLVDTRFSDGRRYVSFNRQTDDLGKVTGLLALAVTPNK